MEPRKFLQNMPDEVFNAWIKPALEKYTWSFSSPKDPVEGTEWEEIFGSNTMFSIFAQCDWAFVNIDIKTSYFHEDSTDNLNRICANAILNAAPEGFDLLSKQKFEHYVRYSLEHKTIAAPIIALYHPRGEFRIVDGHHRFTAFLFAVKNGTSVPCWHPKILQ